MPRQRVWAGESQQPPENHTMSPALESRDSSSPPSPTAPRRIELHREQSSLSIPNNETTPLLHTAGRSRIRIQSAAELLPPKPRLSRHQSVNGMLEPLLEFIRY